MTLKTKKKLTPLQEKAREIAKKIVFNELKEKGYSAFQAKKNKNLWDEANKNYRKLIKKHEKDMKTFRKTSWDNYEIFRINNFKSKIDLKWDTLQPKKAERHSKKERGKTPERKKITKRLDVEFISQIDSRYGTQEEQFKACLKAVLDMASAGGTTIYGGEYGGENPPEKVFKGWDDFVDKTVIKMGTEYGDGIKEDREKAKQGRKYIDSELNSNRPVVVGISDNPGHANDSVDGLSEHFVVIVGRGIDDNEKIYYEFHDPATGNGMKPKLPISDDNPPRGRADNPYNRFYVDSNGGLTKKGNSELGGTFGETYEVASIRRSRESL